jgi:hypothetical protein
MFSQYIRATMLLGLVFTFGICPHASAAEVPQLNPPAASESQEAFALYASLYNPTEDSTQSIYGNAALFGMRYRFPIQQHMNILASVGVLHKTGDPFVNNSTFLNDRTFIAVEPLSRFTYIPIEISYLINIISNPPETNRRLRNIYVGFGANHAWSRERLLESDLAKGSAFGTQFFTGIDFYVSGNLGFSIELKYMRNRPLMKLESDSNYNVQLDAVLLHTMLVWNL